VLGVEVDVPPTMYRTPAVALVTEDTRMDERGVNAPPAAEHQLRGEQVTLRPTAPGDRQVLRAIRDEPEVVRWWGTQTEAWPGDAADVELMTISYDGQVAGIVQFWEDPHADSRHADVDILLTTRLHSQGLGTDAMRTITRHLIEDRGHHRITLSTTPENHRAIRAYEKSGFRHVGVTRLSERGTDGTWHDELLMELVVTPREG
jgi:aminoglycoside 6'-N-acetyltransferase